MSKQKLVVVGNGMAGVRAVEEILMRGGRERFEITIFGAEPYGNYNRILLSNVVSGAQQSFEIFLNQLDWYEENGITLHAGERVKAIDRYSKCVFGDRGTEQSYDKLIVATGSRPFIPPMENLHDETGALRKGVFSFRTLDDCLAIIGSAKETSTEGSASSSASQQHILPDSPTRKRAAVIGGGLLGLEAARGLLTHGCEVHVIHLAHGLMNAQLDAVGSGMLKKAMEEMGVSVHLGKLTTAVLGREQVEGLAFKDGSSLACDMVVISAGIRPNSELARECGLSVQRAIVVDDHMRSVDDKNVYVVGECAQHRDMVYGLVAPLWDQAKVLADHITGVDPKAAYHGSKLATKLKVMGLSVASMGITEPTEEDDEVVQFQEPKKGTYKKLIIRKGRLAGAIMMGDLDKVAYLMQAFDRNTPLPEERLALLFDIGAPEKAVSLEEMSDEVQICNCNGVTKGAISESVVAGNRTTESVMANTRAGTGCGSCKSQVKDLVQLFCTQAVDLPAVPSRDGTLSISCAVPLSWTAETLQRLSELLAKHQATVVGLSANRLDLHGVPDDAREALSRRVQELASSDLPNN